MWSGGWATSGNWGQKTGEGGGRGEKKKKGPKTIGPVWRAGKKIKVVKCARLVWALPPPPTNTRKAPSRVPCCRLACHSWSKVPCQRSIA